MSTGTELMLDILGCGLAIFFIQLGAAILNVTIGWREMIRAKYVRGDKL